MQVIIALLSACYLIWGQLAQDGADHLCASGTALLVPDSLCFGAAGSICPRTPAKGSGGTPGSFSDGGAKPKGPRRKAGGRSGRETHGEHRNKAAPSCPRRWCPSGWASSRCGAGDAAICADTVWPLPASPPRQLRQLQPPNNGDFTPPPPPPNSLQIPSEHRQMSFSGGTERAVLDAGCAPRQLC